jgi:hypothetical protein
MLMRSFVGAAVTAIALVAPSAAHAQLPIESATPANGAAIPPAPSITFVFESAAAAAANRSLTLEVATQPTLGEDGTLAQEYTISTDVFTRGDAFPSRFTYSTPSYVSWPRTPGTYYWVAYCFCVGFGGYGGVLAVSPVHTFTIAQPTPPADEAPLKPITGTEARSYIRPVIRRKLGRQAYGLSAGCRAMSRRAAACEVRWRDTSRSRSTTFQYRGTLRFETNLDGTYAYRFTGTRARYTCVKSRSHARCSRSVRWNRAQGGPRS